MTWRAKARIWARISSTVLPTNSTAQTQLGRPLDRARYVAARVDRQRRLHRFGERLDVLEVHMLAPVGGAGVVEQLAQRLDPLPGDVGARLVLDVARPLPRRPRRRGWRRTGPGASCRPCKWGVRLRTSWVASPFAVGSCCVLAPVESPGSDYLPSRSSRPRSRRQCCVRRCRPARRRGRAPLPRSGGRHESCARGSGRSTAPTGRAARPAR
jgi:hypothetical protein